MLTARIRSLLARNWTLRGTMNTKMQKRMLNRKSKFKMLTKMERRHRILRLII